MIKIRNKLYNKYNILTETDQDYAIELIKQRLKAMSGRLRRYEDINNRKTQNKQFKENQHKFYRKLENRQQIATEIPTKEAIENFWEEILSNPISYNKKAKWINEIEQSMNNICEYNFPNINEEIVYNKVNITQNWKTPGIDKVQNYYLKYLTSTHKYIAHSFNKI